MQANRSTVNWYQTVYRGVFSRFANQIRRTIMKKIRKLLLVTLALQLLPLL